jgi:hypothetical protein
MGAARRQNVISARLFAWHVTRRSDGSLENDFGIGRRDRKRIVDVRMLFAFAFYWRGGNCQRVGSVGLGATVAAGAFRDFSWAGIFSSLPGRTLPDKTEQAGDCDAMCLGVRGNTRVFVSATCGGLDRGRFHSMAAMKRGGIVLAAVIGLGLIVAIGWFLNGGGFGGGMPPAVSLTPKSFEQLQSEFNSTSGSIRVVLLLSPT